MKKFFRNLGFRFSMLKNRTTLLRICNLSPDGVATLTHDEEKLLKGIIQYLKPSQVATRNGKAIYRLKSIEEIGLWAILETRRAEDAIRRIEAWTDDNYAPTTLIDAAKLDKYICQQLEYADNLENVVFQNMRNSGESALTGDENIKQAKNLLGLVQVTAELFHCSFEDAKKMNYSDAMLAIAKRNDEIEKEKKELKKQQSNNR